LYNGTLQHDARCIHQINYRKTTKAHAMNRVVVVVSYGRSTTPTNLPQHRLHHCCHYSTFHFGGSEGKVADPTAHCVLLCPWWHCIRVRLGGKNHCIRVRLGGKNQDEGLFYAVSLAPQCLPILSSYRSDVRSNPRTLLGPKKRQFTQYATQTQAGVGHLQNH
jgi:hypothetical protein